MGLFEYDEAKDDRNRRKHGVSFEQAKLAFIDPQSVIIDDPEHSQSEARYYCLGRVGHDIMTVRFTWRGRKIRIYGAAYWRKGRKRYEEENSL